MPILEVSVPNIGDFKDVAVIELLAAPGDQVRAEQSLMTVESDKASMEIPSPAGGRIMEWLLKLGDKVSEGTLMLRMETAAEEQGTAPEEQSLGRAAEPRSSATASESARASAPEPADATAREAARASVGGVFDCDLLVLGAGPGGYSAAFRAADLGMQVLLVERYSALGGVCLNVGCIPSKALLHLAALSDAVDKLAAHGIHFGTRTVDLEGVRGWKSSVVGKLTAGLAGMARARRVEHVQGLAQFVGPQEIDVQRAGGGTRRIRFAQAIVAAGSEAIRLPFLPNDPRIVDSTGALELAFVPNRMLVIGGGIIGLEMGTVYSTLGARLDVVEMLEGLMPGTDRDLVKVWQQFNRHRFDQIMLETKTVGAHADSRGVHVRFEKLDGTGLEAQYDYVLCAVGRRPNGHSLGLEAAGVITDARGFVPVDTQMRTNQPHIFAIGDIVGQPMLAHKAVHEGHLAAEVAHGGKEHFEARVIPSVAYTDPEIAWAGLTETEAARMGKRLDKAVFPWAASGRAIANGRDEGLTKLLFDPDNGRIVGGAIVGTNAGDMIGEIVLAIEMGADAADIGKTIHPHPTLGESIGMAAEVFMGSCTDLPPRKH
jgi:dihydrolipoamide dehydrogenase